MTYNLNVTKINKLQLSPDESDTYSLLYVILANSLDYKPVPGSKKSAKADTIKKGEIIAVFKEIDSKGKIEIQFKKIDDTNSSSMYTLIASKDAEIYATQCCYNGEPIDLFYYNH